MKKSCVKILVIVMLIACLATALIGCAKPTSTDDLSDLGEIDYKSYKEASGLDSLDMLNKALEYFRACNNYAYTVLLKFATTNNLASQVNKENIKRNGDKVWHEQVTIGTGLGESHSALIRYYDGDKKLIVRNNTKDKKDALKRVPGFEADKGKELDYDISGIAPVAIDGKMPDYEYCKQFKTYDEYLYDRATKYLWFYNVNKADLADAHSSKVYKNGDYYYCDITIDTKNCLKEKNQPDIVKDIEAGIGMALKGFTEDTVFRMKLEAADGGYRFVATYMTEGYKASMASANQTMQRVYKYDAKDTAITADNIKYFAK